MNLLVIKGNLGKDPEVKQTPNGQRYARMTVAVNMGYKDKSGNWVNETQWFDVTAWGDLSEKVASMQKGQPVFIRGEMRSRKSQDKTFWGVRAKEVLPLAKEPSSPQGKGPATQESVTGSAFEDDLPF